MIKSYFYYRLSNITRLLIFVMKTIFKNSMLQCLFESQLYLNWYLVEKTILGSLLIERDYSFSLNQQHFLINNNFAP